MANFSSGLRARFRSLGRLSPDEQGATATEYGILTGFIATAIVTGVGAFGTALNLYFGQLSTGVRNALGIP
ncbi:Flp family type IVb pilin [Arthrobacter sp. UYEF36]|uniref:Flp family type IVb pilin n=1 Tax=Arthrobacter sp. UYEF36 TaxID=1756366 RepID=UPI00339B242C